jgi:uncharacterized protein
MPHLARIRIFPIKSLDGIDVNNATVLPSGALKFDREFAIFDSRGKFVNGKNNAKVHLLRCQTNSAELSQSGWDNRIISLQLPGNPSPQFFHLDTEQQSLAATLSNFFGIDIHLQQNTSIGFPDDTISPGPTIISTATLVEVASWFPGVSPDEMRSRIRANLEIDGVPAFWEDRLFAENDSTLTFRIGNVIFEGINPG